MLRPLALAALLLAAACSRPAPTQAAVTSPAPAPAPAVAGPPCFPDGPPLDATAVYLRLERHAVSIPELEAEDAPPPERFGACTVARGVLRAADGTVVGTLGCGLRILVPGIRDDRGLELGAHGQDVLDRTPAPRRRLLCYRNGEGKTVCRFERTDADPYGTSYVVDGEVGEPLVGAPAEAFFAPRPLVEMMVSVGCH